MTQVYTSSVINAPRDTVWETIRDFGAIADWHPAITTSKIEDGKKGDQVGGIRHLVTGDGGELREQLLCLSDIDCVCTYSIIESPMGVEGYVSILQLTEISNGDGTFAEWSAEFDCPPEAEEGLIEFVGQAVFQGGFDALNESLGKG